MTASAPASRPYAAAARPRNGVGIGALCCGIAGIVLGLIPFMFFASGALAACAIVFGATGIQRARLGEATNRGTAIAGIITGVIAALVAVWGVAIVFSGLDSLSADLAKVGSDTGASAARLGYDQHVAAFQEYRLISEGEFLGNLSASRGIAPTPVTVPSGVSSGRLPSLGRRVTAFRYPGSPLPLANERQTLLEYRRTCP